MGLLAQRAEISLEGEKKKDQKREKEASGATGKGKRVKTSEPPTRIKALSPKRKRDEQLEVVNYLFSTKAMSLTKHYNHFITFKKVYYIDKSNCVSIYNRYSMF